MTARNSLNGERAGELENHFADRLAQVTDSERSQIETALDSGVLTAGLNRLAECAANAATKGSVVKQ